MGTIIALGEKFILKLIIYARNGVNKKEMSSCTVCDEKYNKSTRKLVKCECAYKACMTCVKRYLLDKSYQKPHCMSCKKDWTPEFQQGNFTKAFWTSEYREAREKVLFEEEKTHLPPLQAEADRMVRLRIITEQMEVIRRELGVNDKNEDQYVRDQRRIDRELNERLDVHKTEYHKTYTKKPSTAVKVFVMKCPMEDCRGYLSEKNICGMCHVSICKDCNEAKDVDVDVPHVCDKDSVATMIEIRKTSKPCPKCNMAISKIDGCDQMFCIAPNCHTAFSWQTGLVETGVIHNPHYFEALRAGNIRDPRHRQHQGGCGPIPDFYEISGYLNQAPITEQVYLKIRHHYQRFVHHRQWTMPRLLEQDDRRTDRINYLTGVLDEKKFKQKVYVASMSDVRRKEEQQIIDSYVTIGEELFRELRFHNANETHSQLETLTNITHTAIVGLDSKHKYAGFIKPRDIKI